MKTNEVQKVSEHLKKSFISVSHLETARIEGGRAPYFFHKILLRSFVTVNLPSRTHRGSIPRCFPPCLLGQSPGIFPAHLPRGPCHWHRLVRGVNPILWTGLSWSNSFFGTSRLAAVGSACLRCGQGCVEAAAGPWLHTWLSQPASTIHLSSSGPKDHCCRYAPLSCLLFGFISFVKPQCWTFCSCFNWDYIYLFPMKWFSPVNGCESS